MMCGFNQLACAADFSKVQNASREIQQAANPHDIYHHPANPFPAGFNDSPGTHFFKKDIRSSDFGRENRIHAAFLICGQKQPFENEGA
ncbi:hypothetical protein [Bacillus swezeyi]|uniref:hypothetical protein n=1 Tax=Bacillus swezeyi TaxID=1925020 RepID=UPI003F8BA15F